MCVPMSSPAKTVQEFIAHAKANPGKVTYASSGYGTSLHLSGELFNRMAGVDLQHIPYRGAGPAFNDLIPGRVDVMFNNTASAMPFIKGGKLRPLGVTSLKRNVELPDVPTISEAGVPGFEVIGLLCVLRTRQDAAGDHRQVSRRHRQGAGRSGDPAADRSARRPRDRLDAGRAWRVPQIRDGQVGSDHQGGRHQGRMTDSSAASPLKMSSNGAHLSFWTGRNRPSITAALSPKARRRRASAPR